jgi:all-trans-8'-apo-beta-carotenal 15,15'-oxygenase
MLTLDAATTRLFEQDGGDVEAHAVEQFDGEWPSLQCGTWYLNGPGRFRCRDLTYGHWLDGDGLIRAITFDGRGVTVASRFVRTRKFTAEHACGRPLFRTFGTGFRGDLLNERGSGLESPANVSVFRCGAHLLAFGEQGLPWRLDPSTLDTLGPFTADGALTTVTPFSAHAKPMADGSWFNFGVGFSAARPLLHLFRFDGDGRQRLRARVPLHCSATIHDFALGPSVAAFYVSPYVLDVDALRRGAHVLASLRWRPALGSRMLIVRLESGERIASVDLGARACLHTINCYEDGDSVVVDVIELAEPIYANYHVPALFEAPIHARFVRFTIDIAAGRVASRVELPHDGGADFPVIAARDAQRDYEHCWSLGLSAPAERGPKFFDRLVRVSWRERGCVDAYQAPDGTFLGGEPLLADAADGRRMVVCQLFDSAARRGGLAVFDAFALARGPLARAWLPSATPMAFHGCFVPAAVDSASASAATEER